jgi:hypothetical protein
MNLFIYLINLGIVFIIMPISMLIAKAPISYNLFKFINRTITYLIGGIKHYIIILLSSAITIGAINESYYGDNSWIIFSIIGGIALYLTQSATTYENIKSATEKYDYELARMFQYDIFFLIGSIILYIIMLFNPSLVENFLSIGFFKLVGYIYSFTIIRIVLNICGALFMLSMLYYGIIGAFAISIMSVRAIGSLVRKPFN